MRALIEFDSKYRDKSERHRDEVMAHHHLSQRQGYQAYLTPNKDK
jgi:hypothetical protein